MSEKSPKQYSIQDDLKIYDNPSLDLERYYTISCLKKKDIKQIRQFISKNGNNGTIQFQNSTQKSGRKVLKFDYIKPLDQNFIQSAQWFSIKKENKSNTDSKVSVHPKVEKIDQQIYHSALPFKKKIRLDSPESHVNKKPLLNESLTNNNNNNNNNKENIQELVNQQQQQQQQQQQSNIEEKIEQVNNNNEKLEPQQFDQIPLKEQSEEEKLEERVEQFSQFYCLTKEQITQLYENVNGNWDHLSQVLNGNEYLEWKPYEDAILREQRYHSYGYKLLIYYKTKQEVVKRIQRLALDVPLDITFQFDLDVK